MTDDPLFSRDKAASENEIAFDYVKAPEFRMVWTDGIVGGVTPRGHIHFAAFSERLAIPRRQVFEMEKTRANTGQLGKEVVAKQVSRDSVVREMSVDLLMTPDVAENVANWILARVAEFKRIQADEKKEGEE